jgi:hypothetical protein
LAPANLTIYTQVLTLPAEVLFLHILFRSS